jgi:hypothetical protein
MRGDQTDMLSRLRAALPARWFPDVAPVLDGLLSGLAQAQASTFGLIAYARGQTRIATATDLWLDLIAQDCFGVRVQRRAAEADGPFRARIQRELLRPRATRAALAAQLLDLTGSTPWIFEPSRPADTGAWGGPAGYGVAGGWGNLAMPFQCLVVARRPLTGGIPLLPGYGSGGYRVAGAYASLAALAGVTDADIDATIAAVMPACGIAWTRITA